MPGYRSWAEASEAGLGQSHASTGSFPTLTRSAESPNPGLDSTNGKQRRGWAKDPDLHTLRMALGYMGHVCNLCAKNPR